MSVATHNISWHTRTRGRPKMNVLLFVMVANILQQNMYTESNTSNSHTCAMHRK